MYAQYIMPNAGMTAMHTRYSCSEFDNLAINTKCGDDKQCFQHSILI